MRRRLKGPGQSDPRQNDDRSGCDTLLSAGQARRANIVRARGCNGWPSENRLKCKVPDADCKQEGWRRFVKAESGGKEM